MSVPWTELAGCAAAACTTASFVPQVLRVRRTRSAADLSAAMYALFITGLALWTVYGTLRADWPIVAANVVTLALAMAVLWMKWRYRPRP